jgi:hypothetical protein
MVRTLIAYIIYIVAASAVLRRVLATDVPHDPPPRARQLPSGTVAVMITVEDGSALTATCVTSADRVSGDVIQTSTVTERDHMLEALGCSGH